MASFDYRIIYSILALAVSAVSTKEVITKSGTSPRKYRTKDCWRVSIPERHSWRLSFLLFCFLIAVGDGASLGQADPTAGILPFSVNLGGQYDSFNPATGTVTLTIPVLSKAGKIPFSYNLVGNFHVFLYNCCNGGYAWEMPQPGYYGVFNGGINGLAASALGSRLYYTSSNANCNGVNDEITVNNFSLTDSTGASHSFGGDFVTYGPCGNSGGGTGPSNDSTGYTLSITATNPPQYSLYDRSGNTLTLSPGSFNYMVVTAVTDPDNVAMSVSTQTNSTVATSTYTDTLGVTALTATVGLSRVASSNSAPDTYTYTDVKGNPQTAKVNYTLSSLRTNYGCSGVQDVNVGSAYIPTSVVLADGETFGLSYESTRGYTGSVTGRLAKLTLPDGGSITYTYSGGSNGVECVGGYTYAIPILTRTINDGNGHISSWTYTSSTVDNYNNFSVTAQDPVGDTTVYHFYATFPTETTVTDVNQGLLSTTVTCYNGNNTSQSACIAPQQTYAITAPVKQTDVYTSLGSSAPALVETQYDGDGIQYGRTYGNVIAVKQYGVGATYPPSGTPIQTTSTTYANIAGSSCGPTGYIYDRPCTAAVTGSTGVANQVTYYTYNAAGHPTKTSNWVTGSTYLNSFATYNSNGTIATATTPSNATTYYYYNGTGGCNNLLPTSTVIASLTTAQQWNCFGAVETSATDANGNITLYGYVDQNGQADPLWRLRSITDPLTNVTWNTYSPAGTIPATFETSMTFNTGLSTTDQLTTFDGLARPILQQTRQAPGSSNFDTVSIAYDTNGRRASQGMPCVSTAASTACSSSSTTTTYDALNRPLVTTDGGGGTVTEAYSGRDVLRTVGPAPVQEHVKSRQLEYDGIGRLASVCEVLASGGTSCAQSSPASGYKTSYAYSVPSSGGSQMGVTQGAQGRTYLRDGLGRLISESNPESGSTTYGYDGAPCGWPAEPGYLTSISYANGIGWCIVHNDPLGRLTDVGFSGGTNPYCVRYRYDNVSNGAQVQPSGSTISNPAGRMVEAETDTCSYSGGRVVAITDEWFSYDKDGNITDVWELTPHSTEYYHSVATYFGNGQVATIQPVTPSFSQMAYGLDGEGRWKTFTQVGGRNIVTGTTRNAAGQPTQILLLGTPDQDNYTYDPNTNNMKTFDFQVVSSHMTGTLTWNPNGTLQKLAIIDGFNSGGTQTCADTYDDIMRLITYDCGSGGWGQNFTYDQYGNLSKSVISGRTGTTWLPGYNTANHYTCSGCTYDSNGNVTSDGNNSYYWGGFGNLQSVANGGGTPTCGTSGNCAIYDAFGRLVEYSNGSTWMEIFRMQAGAYIVATGATFYYTQWPTPAGGWVESAGGAPFYHHKDWLGNARVISNESFPAVAVDRAYTPYGEMYDAFGNTTPGANAEWATFAGLKGVLDTGVMWDTPNRELSTVGRWLSPDPAGLAAVDPTNPQSWNRYAYVLNNPLSSTDPNGLECVWDDGSYDSNSDPETGNPGSCENAGGSWVDHSYFQQNGLADWSGGPNSDIANYAQNFTTTVTATPCPTTATTSQRITAGIQGALNVGIGGAKIYALGTAGVASIAAAPETVGASLLVIAPLGYEIFSSQGQIASGMGQLVTAFSGDLQAGQGIQQVGDIMSGPLLGVPTLMATQNGATAQKAANIESYVTAGAGFVNSKGMTGFIQGAVDWGLSTIGVTGTFSDSGCN